MKKAIFLMCVCAMTLCCVSVIAQERSAKEIMVGATKAVKRSCNTSENAKDLFNELQQKLKHYCGTFKKERR